MAAQVVYTPPQPGATYYPQAAPVVFVPQRQPKYQYIPNDYLTCTVITALLCGLFSPLTLMFTIPAYLFARKSQASMKMGDIRKARDQGMVAAYLNIIAIVFALVVAAVAIGVAIGVYGPIYYRPYRYSSSYPYY